MKTSRLMIIRIIGILLLIASIIIVWINVSGGNRTSFWDYDDRIPDSNIYETPGVWVNQKGDSIALDIFKDKVTVATFVFAECDYTCPILIDEVRKIEKGLGDKSDKV